MAGEAAAHIGSTKEDLKPDAFQTYDFLPDSIDAFFAFDGLDELHQETPYDSLWESYRAAKAHWGDLMWHQDLDYLDIKNLNPEVTVRCHDTDIVITPMDHDGEIFDRTRDRIYYTQRAQSESEPVYLEQLFGMVIGNSGLREMDDVDWMYEEYGILPEDYFEILDEESENNIAGYLPLAGQDDMEKGGQMGAAQYALVNFLPEPLEYDWCSYTGTVDRIVLSERSMRMGDILANQAENTGSDMIRAYIGAAHTMGVLSTLRKHEQDGTVPDIEFRHGAHVGLKTPLSKAAYWLEKRKMA